MTRIAPTEYMPDVAIPPGETIRETLESMGMTQAEFAQRIGRPPTKVNAIIRGKKAITVNTAIALGRVTPFPADFWLNLEKNYRLTLARLQEQEALEEGIRWMRRLIPVAELVKRGKIPKALKAKERFKAVLQFFGVSSIKGWESYWEERIAGAVAFRRSRKHAEHIGRVAAWLRLGELEAKDKPCKPFNKRRFRAALTRIRAATTEPREVFEPLLHKLADCGVIVSLIKEIPGAGISGATWWFGGNKAHIQLSLRYKSDDQFWFTFFHEAGHVLLHKGEMFLEGESWTASKAKEAEANRFSADFLIPPTEAAKLPRLTERQQVIDFAKQIGIAPGIVAGQLYHKGYVTPQLVNYWKVKQRLDWAEDGGD